MGKKKYIFFHLFLKFSFEMIEFFYCFIFLLEKIDPQFIIEKSWVKVMNNLNHWKKRCLISHINLYEQTSNFKMLECSSYVKHLLYVISPIDNIHISIKKMATLDPKVQLFLCLDGTKFQIKDIPIFWATRTPLQKI
jgi:hypothetical protein